MSSLTRELIRDQAGVASGAWRARAKAAAEMVGTPCYVFSAACVRRALQDFTATIQPRMPVIHWLSVKTLPVRPLVSMWADWGLDVEVVSEFEYVAARQVGLPPSRILVNGVAKHHWLRRHDATELNLHFDSVNEVRALRDRAAACHWRVGLRCQVPGQFVPETGGGYDPFGLTEEEALAAISLLREADVAISGVHFHIHHGFRTAAACREALNHLRHICDRGDLHPKYVDLGGGLSMSGEPPTAQNGDPDKTAPELAWFGRVLDEAAELFPGIREIWLENGRYMTGRAGALVMRVLDRKDRPSGGHLICDAGRVNHARMAAMETHPLAVEPVRTGPTKTTILWGSSCAPIDALGQWELPEDVTPGDLVLWLEAGAYNLSLETRFSNGLAPVVWFDDDERPMVARYRETTAEWWRRWV